MSSDDEVARQAAEAAGAAFCASPPSLRDLEWALSRCAQPEGALTAQHLALPVGVVPQLAVRSHAGVLAWRSARLAASADPAADALLLALSGWVSRDRWLDLSMAGTADMTAWVKPLRSGTRTVVFGAREVLGLPHLVADPTLPPDGVLAAVRALHLGGRAPAKVRVRRQGELLSLERM